jgi:hypothetical protein
LELHYCLTQLRDAAEISRDFKQVAVTADGGGHLQHVWNDELRGAVFGVFVKEFLKA